MVERKEEGDNEREGEGEGEGEKEDTIRNLKENSENHKDRISIKTKEREHWSSYYGFIFAAIGAAVGIGNIWRYPYVVGTNGGGAFLLTYLIVVFTFGLAFMVLELIVGRYYQSSIILSLGNIKNSFKYFGIFIVIVTFAIVSYYLVILGWILSYFVFSLIGIINSFSFDDFTNSYYPIVAYMAVITINYLIIRTDISKGIEKISKVGVLLLIAIIIPLSILGIATPGSDKGIEFYLKPDFSKLADPSIWSIAFGQAFFSLSIGMGVLVTYGSYIQKQQEEEEEDRDERVKKRQISLVISSSIVIISDISSW